MHLRIPTESLAIHSAMLHWLTVALSQICSWLRTKSCGTICFRVRHRWVFLHSLSTLKLSKLSMIWISVTMLWMQMVWLRIRSRYTQGHRKTWRWWLDKWVIKSSTLLVSKRISQWVSPWRVNWRLLSSLSFSLTRTCWLLSHSWASYVCSSYTLWCFQTSRRKPMNLECFGPLVLTPRMLEWPFVYRLHLSHCQDSAADSLQQPY